MKSEVLIRYQPVNLEQGIYCGKPTTFKATQHCQKITDVAQSYAFPTRVFVYGFKTDHYVVYEGPGAIEDQNPYMRQYLSSKVYLADTLN